MQERHGGAADSRDPDDTELVIQREMLVPGILPGMKQSDGLPGIRILSLAVAALAQGAGDACKGEVVEQRGASFSTRLDVIDVKRRFLASLSQAAVLTPLFRTIPDATLQRNRNMA